MTDPADVPASPDAAPDLDVWGALTSCREAVARAWFAKGDTGKVMDPDFAEAVAQETARFAMGWQDSAAMFHRNEMYYRGLLDEIGHMLGPDAFRCDDGSVSDSVLRAKLPKLVKARIGP